MSVLVIALAIADAATSGPSSADANFDLSKVETSHSCGVASVGDEILVYADSRRDERLTPGIDDKEHVIGEAEYKFDNGFKVRFGLHKNQLTPAQQKAAPDLKPTSYTDVPGISVTIPF